MMVNLDNQRPGDTWIIQGSKYDVLMEPKYVEYDGAYIYMRHQELGVVCVVAILPRTSNEIDALAKAAGLL